MKHLIAAAAFAVTLVAAGATASAELLQLRAEALGGGSYGKGVGGDQQDFAFHDGASGGSWGFDVGIEILFIDVFIQHQQYLGSGGLLGTWTEFMAGLDFDFDLSDKTKGGTWDEKKKKRVGKGRYAPVYGEIGVNLGFGVGTGQQIDPPLDNAQITDKGFLVEARLGVGYRFNKVISAGLTVPIQFAHVFKNDVPANDLSSQYQQIQVAALANLRFTFTIK